MASCCSNFLGLFSFFSGVGVEWVRYCLLFFNGGFLWPWRYTGRLRIIDSNKLMSYFVRSTDQNWKECCQQKSYERGQLSNHYFITFSEISYINYNAQRATVKPHWHSSHDFQLIHVTYQVSLAHMLIRVLTLYTRHTGFESQLRLHL